MTEKRKILYGLLLCGIFLLLSALIAPGKAYARYNTSASWNTVINAPSGITPVLTEDNAILAFPLPEATGEVTFAIQKMGADGSYLDHTQENLTILSEGDNVQIHLGKPLPPAGTYRLVITEISEDAESTFVEMVTFFVNYSDS